MDTLWSDLRYAGRRLLRAPGFTAVALLSLALGIGANTTIFTVVNGVALKPLPVDRPRETVALFTSDFSGPPFGASSYPDYLDFGDGDGVLAGLVAYAVTPVSLQVGGTTERAMAEVVTGNYFPVTGVPTVLGRGLRPADDRPEAAPVAVLSHRLWQRRFGADRGLVGRSVVLNGNPVEIVGIVRPGFGGLLRGIGVDLWVPMAFQPRARPGSRDLTSRGARGLFLLGRLKPGVTVSQAQARFDGIARRLHESYRDSWTNRSGQSRTITVVPESGARIFPEVRLPVLGFLGLLTAVVGLVLLIACTNLANLLLARAVGRRKEIGIRLSLGAGRWRLVRQLLTESLVLALAGGGLGFLLAVWGADLLAAFQPPLPVPVLLDLRPDGRVLAFTLLLSTATGLLFGLIPALATTRPDLLSCVKDEQGKGVLQRLRLRSALVVAQVAVCLLLLIGSGLFLRSLRNAQSIDAGFDPDRLLMMSVDLALGGYEESRGREMYDRMVASVRALPGVEAAALTKEAPLGLASGRRHVWIGGYTPGRGEDMEVSFTVVGSGYFETMGIPIRRGRAIGAMDRPGRPGVAVVNEAFARRYWPGQEPLGRTISLTGEQGPFLEVVGVAKDGKYVTLGEEPRPFLYTAMGQEYQPDLTLVARTSSPPSASLGAVRHALQSLDPHLPVFDAKTMVQHLGFALFPARVAGALLGIFGFVALALASIGLYGVMSYMVSQRTREVGIRMALGARREDVLRLVVGQGLRLAAAGIASGLVGAFVLTRFLASLLYGITPTDPVTFLGVTAALAAVILLASYVPARRAASADPMAALRHE